MSPSACHVICFSPTGTTRKVACAVAAGVGLPFSILDITLPGKREAPCSLDPDELLIVAVPVYYGRVVKLAAEYFATLKGRGQPAVLLVNYGNRHYDDALLELLYLAKTGGLRPLAAGAFVSEHSFSTPDYPMAQGRPDADDLALAVDFGRQVAKKLCESGFPSLDYLPGNAPYKIYPDFHRAPVSDAHCTCCGVCVDLCPTGAIVIKSDSLSTDEQACIVCQACVKICPENARRDTKPGVLETREHLKTLTAERRKPELFF